jgi:hypothetical protein
VLILLFKNVSNISNFEKSAKTSKNSKKVRRITCLILIFLNLKTKAKHLREHPLMMSDFFWGGEIGQNQTRGVGSLAKIGHPIIL